MNNANEFTCSLTQFENIENFKKLVNIRAEKGYVVEGGRVREWAFLGFRAEGERHFLYARAGEDTPESLPAADSLVSLSRIITMKKEEALPKLLLIAEAVSLLISEPARQYEIGLDTVYVSGGDAVVFLPATLFRKMKEMGREEYSFQYLQVNNPFFLKQADRAVWALEALCYRVLLGSFPFDGKTVASLRDQIRIKGCRSPFLQMPELKPEIGQHFESFFATKETAGALLSGVIKNLKAWIKNGVALQLDDAKKTEVKARAEQELKVREKGFGRRLFWEKNWQAFVIGGGLVVVLGILVLFYLSTSVFKPRSTSGYVPEKVMDVFFESLNNLDTSRIQDCVTGDAKKGWVSGLDFLFPQSRQYEAMAGKPLVVNAAGWLAAGKPPVDPPRFVFGAAGLVITQEAGEPDPVFIADYAMYFRDKDPDNRDSDIQYNLVYKMKERYYFKKDGRDWVIFRIETLEKQLNEKKAVDMSAFR